MKPLRHVLAVSCLMLVSIAFPRAHAEEAGPVEKRVEAWVSTFNENDPEAMVDFYEDTEDLNMLVSAGLWRTGTDEVRKAYEDDRKNWEYDDSKLKNLRVRNLGDVALAAFEHRFKIRSLKEDLRLQIHIRTTMTLRKIGSEWKIVAEHSSAIDGVERITEITGK